MANKRPPISPQQRREICAVAETDERTVRRTYAGKTTRPTTFERIANAAVALGHPVPPPPDSAPAGDA